MIAAASSGFIAAVADAAGAQVIPTTTTTAPPATTTTTTPDTTEGRCQWEHGGQPEDPPRPCDTSVPVQVANPVTSVTVAGTVTADMGAGWPSRGDVVVADRGSGWTMDPVGTVDEAAATWGLALLGIIAGTVFGVYALRTPRGGGLT